MAKGARSWGSCCAGARLWVERRRKRMRATVQVGTGVTEAAPPVQEEPAVAAESQLGSAARPEGRKRDRSKKAESEGKAEAKPGKRQKSLFDCISYINIKFNSLTLGDGMKKMILLISAFCFLTLMGMAVAQSNANQSMIVLTQDSGANITKMNMTLYSVGQDWGINAFSVGEAVKFTAPKPGWKLKQIRVLGWNGFNETTLAVPSPSNFLIEVRDEKLNLLYRLADTQNAYFTLPAPALIAINIPALPLTGVFYIIFYDRSTMRIGVELEKGTGNSYQYNSMYGELIPAEFKIDNNESTKVNWVIRAVGE